MKRVIFAGLCAATTFAGGAVVLAQQFPDAPAKGFGTSITGAFEGWFNNPDGSHTFLVGYYNRNIKQAMDVPIGPNNRIEPGGPDMGQPTHFLPGRQTGVFTITVPKAFAPEQKLTWTIVVNGQPMVIPLRLNIDYNVSPFKDAAIGNTPPVLHLFDEKAPGIQGPINSLTTNAIARTATVASGLSLPIWATDDAKYSSGSNAPMRNPPPPVTITWAKYRGPGAVTFDNAKPKLEALTGGNIGEPFSGKATVQAKFAEPGDYVLQLVVNDYTGAGGGGEVCCWTNALVKVAVTP
jgi:hypothetical protein